MSDWIILATALTGFDHAATKHKVLATRDYLARPDLFRGARPNIINLSRSYSYQSRGYYASLLAAARGQRVIPSVETIIDLSARKLYENSIPELEDVLNKGFGKSEEPAPARLKIYFGTSTDPRFERFGRQLFDWFRAPVVEVAIKDGKWRSISRISLLPVAKLTGADRDAFFEAMAIYTGRQWRDAKSRTPARYSIATLMDANEAMPPSSVETLRHWARIAARMGVAVEPIGRKDLARLANFDALFIRETTSISNHTYRFARRAQQEGMPVIDDPVSMIRCTNKVYLDELMAANGVPVPQTIMVIGVEDLQRAADTLGFPMVLKIPDSSFSRGVSKVKNMEELRKLAGAWLADSDVLIAQKYMPTSFDWRIGVLGGKPLFAVQYLMAKQHWQIVKHDTGGKPLEGGFRTFSLAETPPRVLDTGLRAARCIGDGLYGVDLKETEDGVFVIEVNDNPNLEHGVEDSAEKDEVWTRLTNWFIERIDS
ncbi:glutathione synthase/RimK-type ligase-like ATP-grasp enzyme [Hoeflea marina]|uniref:Glutathione synthase/RimK-type ligase-like ATP-grasp enzyme n=1 Tax=Hoeflea marina TaxID=274592 RepID=A0A317PNV8_9HYPH|nr:RimK family protein [Hoeflea marina]PWW00181.1 glutathione synthase/RimK-type ligase-like ATP-grasp enzyme [Hoeflea marina]